MSTHHTAKAAVAKTAPALLAAPFLLVETDLNAAIVSFNTPVVINGSGFWNWSFTTTGLANVSVSNSIFESNGNFYNSALAGMLFFNASFVFSEALTVASGATIDNSLTFFDFAYFEVPSTTALYAFEVFSTGNFGWAEITVTALPDTFTINRWAVETVPGAAIAAGAGAAVIPEPNEIMAGLTALALGAAVVQRKRRREKEKAEQISA